MPKLNSRRTRDERHAAMTAATDIITKNEKLAQQAKTERLRNLREERDASEPVTSQPAKRTKTSQSIPIGKMMYRETMPSGPHGLANLTKRAGTEMIVSRACVRIREDRGASPSSAAKSEMWAQVVALRSDYPQLTDDEIINVVISDYEP